MSHQLESIYEFGPFRIDVGRRLLLREGETVSLTSKSFDTLLVLIERRGEIVNKDELMKRLWPDTIVEENNLTQQISMLRKALGERANEHRYVLTVPGRGYRFIAEVNEACLKEPDLIVEQHTRSRITVAVEDEPESETPGLAERIKSLPGTPRAARRWQASRSAIVAIPVALALLTFALSVWLSSQKTEPQNKSELKKSIAVLPFKSLNSDSANDYLGTGMSDTLIAKLSNIRQISVRPTSTVIKYAGQSQDAQMIGRELGVDSVLEGTVQKAGDRVRVTVQLVNVQDRHPLWAQSYDEKITDIFTLQDVISEQVAQTMLVKLNVDEQRQHSKRETENVEAYQEYLRGRYFWNKRNEEGLKKSLEHFQHAITLDPVYAQAYAGLADTYTVIAHYGIKPYARDDAFQKGRAAATRALDIDDTLAEAHTSLAFIKTYYDHDDSGAESEFKRAIELNPNYATAHHWYSEYLAMRGQEQEAMTEIRRAQELDPLSPIINTTLGERLYLARRYDESIRQLQKTVEIAPDFGAAHYTLGLAFEQKGMYEDAISELRKARDMSGNSQNVLASLGHTLALAGQKGAAHRILDELLAKDDPVPYAIAVVYQGLGEKQQTIGWLKKVKDKKDALDMMLKLDPRLDNLRDDPGFRDLL
jgi:TolB-like protein/DNA-binding winged helix-turn-helix (wHTH) protein/Flp pilus assembly protein TadD